MTKESFTKVLSDVCRSLDGNRITSAEGFSGEAFYIFDEPLVGFSSASDELYQRFLDPAAIGENYMMPKDWLAGAKTVISFFFPFSERVRESNALMTGQASQEWAYGRVEGQAFISNCIRKLCSELTENGFEAVAPSLDPRFKLTGLVSNWSERHAAFVSGLGTFGMSRGMITKKGIAGRFGSIITSLEFEPDRREYTDIYEYCIKCGACARRCPAGAFDIKSGLKIHSLCQPFVDRSKTLLAPRYGCGLCQTKVPCQNGIPAKKQST